MRKKIVIGLIITLTLLLIGGMYYPLPYFISKPGMAKELEPIIEVEDGYQESGEFMLTTIRMGRANLFSYLQAKTSKYSEIYSEDMILNQEETEEEYNVRQLHLMSGSKQSAIEVAYRKAGLPVDYHYKGIFVMQVMDGMPADGKLQAGDSLFKIDGKSFASSKEFIDYIGEKRAGDKITITFKRKKVEKTVTIQLQPLKDEPNRAGIGIYLVDDKEIRVEPIVKLKTDDIGGPSAGLMFSLEIYNQLTKKDYTKGYKIAGTGTIEGDGAVGPIGGIEQKIVAADKAGAEIFFAPNGKGAKDSNYQAALETAHDINSKMTIVPIDTFDQAIEYLDALPQK